MTHTSTTEQQLITQAINGDGRAFERLMQPHLTNLRRQLRGFFKRDEDIDDTLQDILLRVHRGLPRFKAESKFSTWLFTICANTARNTYARQRKHAANVSFDEVESDALEYAVTSSDDGEALLTASQRYDELRNALSKLHAPLAEALCLREIEQLSYDEIAERMSCPASTARTRVFRAREALKAEMQLAF